MRSFMSAGNPEDAAVPRRDFILLMRGLDAPSNSPSGIFGGVKVMRWRFSVTAWACRVVQ